MCHKIVSVNCPETITGYKAAIEINGKYRSPATYTKYEIGKILSPPKNCTEHLKKISSNYDAELILLPGKQFYNPDMKGRTGLFDEINDFFSFNGNTKYDVLLKITGRKVATAISNGVEISLIDEIYSIKETTVDVEINI